MDESLANQRIIGKPEVTMNGPFAARAAGGGNQRLTDFSSTLLGLLLIFLAASGSARAADSGDIRLPEPRKEGGMPLMEALAERESSRSFSARELPAQVLSDLLWAGAGINRPDSGKRTAPSARNWQEISVYAVTAAGVYLYDAESNLLKQVVEGDIRAKTGTQDFAAKAPLNLVFVADLDRMQGVSPEDQSLYIGADTGFISQNIYLFCASAGLATVVRGSVNREELAGALGLGPTRRVVMAQTVGYPEEAEGR